MNVYIGLVHYPVLDRTGAAVATAISNLDVHDLARLAATYDLAGYYVITPVTTQQALVRSMIAHWQEGGGKARVPSRSLAFNKVRVADTIATAVADIGAAHIYVTAARQIECPQLPFEEAARCFEKNESTLLLFGTGHGLHADAYANASATLPPIRGGGYNHLSVRTAAAITLDRIFGERRATPAKADAFA